MTHLLRPGVRGALAALELVLARLDAGDFRLDYARRWARHLDREQRFDDTLRRAGEMRLA